MTPTTIATAGAVATAQSAIAIASVATSSDRMTPSGA